MSALNCEHATYALMAISHHPYDFFSALAASYKIVKQDILVDNSLGHVSVQFLTKSDFRQKNTEKNEIEGEEGVI